MRNDIWDSAQPLTKWSDDNYTYQLLTVPRETIDDDSNEPNAHLLIGLDSSNVRRVDILLDTAYSRTINDPNGSLAVAISSAPHDAREILNQYVAA